MHAELAHAAVAGLLTLLEAPAEGTISPEDLELFSYAETAEEAWAQISTFHAGHEHEFPLELLAL